LPWLEENKITKFIVTGKKFVKNKHGFNQGIFYCHFLSTIESSNVLLSCNNGRNNSQAAEVSILCQDALFWIPGWCHGCATCAHQIGH
jgi:hypothetical protein